MGSFNEMCVKEKVEIGKHVVFIENNETGSLYFCGAFDTNDLAVVRLEEEKANLRQQKNSYMYNPRIRVFTEEESHEQ